jgi:ABC-type dipeptide/oligopeptide/nickel transport system permease component
MRRFALRESGRLALGLLGALLLAAAVSALSLPGAHDGARGFLAAMASRLLAYVAFDPGSSAVSGLAAAQELIARGPTTLKLVLQGMVIAAVLGIPLSLVSGAASLRNALAPLGQFVSAVPVFCAALLLAYVVNRLLGSAPPGTPFPLLPRDLAGWSQVLAPALTVGLAGMAAVHVGLRRASVALEGAPFRQGLGRLGLPARDINRFYVVPAVLAGLLRNLGEVIVALLSAVVVAEWVFHCPGIADLFVKSVALHDWNMVAPILFLFAATAMIADFAGRIAAHIVARDAA